MSNADDLADEIALFETFPAETRLLIARGLDFGLPRGNPMSRWSKGDFPRVSDKTQRFDLMLDFVNLQGCEENYRCVPEIRSEFQNGFKLERCSRQLFFDSTLRRFRCGVAWNGGSSPILVFV